MPCPRGSSCLFYGGIILSDIFVTNSKQWTLDADWLIPVVVDPGE